MLSSSFLDIAIGVVFIFLLLSLIATTVNEIILSLLNMRGRKLLRGIETLFGRDTQNKNADAISDSENAKANALVRKLYNHGQIFGLFEGQFNRLKPGNLPSYIPTTNFVNALLGVLHDEASKPPDGSPPPGSSPSRNPAAQIDAIYAWLERDPDVLSDKVRKPLLAMLASADKLETLERSIADWYNSAMDRVSGWYKYHTQKWLFGIGVVLAIGLNANTISIVQQLSRNPTLRETIVAAAQNKSNQGTNAGQTDLNTLIGQLNGQISGMRNLGIPLGWSKSDQQAWGDVFREAGRQPGNYFGWLLTAIAVSMGAPFWFDMLNKIMIVRSTVKPGEKSKQAPTKDKKQTPSASAA